MLFFRNMYGKMQKAQYSGIIVEKHSKGSEKVNQFKKNEITVKIKCELDEFYKILKEKGFKEVKAFTLDDTFFIPSKVKEDIDKLTTRNILSKAVLIRNIQKPNCTVKTITYKYKEFNEAGDIINQNAINCKIEEIDQAKRLLTAIDYKEIMRIVEHDVVYEKDGFELAVKNVENGYNLIEIETKDDEKNNTIEKLKQQLEKHEIPVYTDDYFVKKAEIELNKILGRDEKTSY